MSVRDVAYVVNTFPKLSETFITNEIAALVRREHERWGGIARATGFVAED